MLVRFSAAMAAVCLLSGAAFELPVRNCCQGDGPAACIA